MTGPGASRHYGEELQDLLDGRLAESQRSEVEAHVASCARCHRELEALRWVKAELPRHVKHVDPPADLSARVRARLDEPAHGRSRAMWMSGVRRVPRRAWIAGAVAAAVLLAVFWRGHKAVDLPSAVAADFAAYENGTTNLEFVSSDSKAVEAYFARSGVRFTTHVYDLAMMNYRLAGGRVNRLDGRASALFTYLGPDDTALVCQMYEGSVRDLPRTDDVREHNGFMFYVYRSANVTLVFWQEDGVVCVLASDAPTENVVQLAFAKAMRAD